MREIMEIKQSTVVDFKQRETVCSTLPHPPLLYTQVLNSNCYSVGFEYYLHPAHETPNHCISQHTLVIILNSIGKIHRQLGEECQSEQDLFGKIALIPANVPHWAAWEETVEFILLTFDPQFLAECDRESVEPDRVEILPYFAQCDQLVYQIGLILKDLLKTGEASDRLYIDSLLSTLSIHILKNYASRSFTFPEYFDGLPRHRLKRVLEFINENLDQDIKLTNLATEVGISQYYFCRLFKQSMGITPYQYLLQQRIEQAKKLLKKDDLLIADIALICGFNGQSHFTYQFRKLTGVTPKTYRNNYKS
jgi:AraC family transcriptional regulator